MHHFSLYIKKHLRTQQCHMRRYRFSCYPHPRGHVQCHGTGTPAGDPPDRHLCRPRVDFRIAVASYPLCWMLSKFLFSSQCVRALGCLLNQCRLFKLYHFKHDFLLKIIFDGSRFSTPCPLSKAHSSLGPEVKALCGVFGARPLDHFLYLHSVKPNLGHTEAVAGLAGLAAAILCTGGPGAFGFCFCRLFPMFARARFAVGFGIRFGFTRDKLSPDFFY